MTIPDQTAIASWAAKNIATIIAGGLFLLAVIVAVYLVFVAPQNARNDTAAAKGEQAISSAGNQSAHQAVETVAKDGENEAKIDDTTRNDHAVIIHEPGASVPISDALDAAGRRAICLHDSTASLPECQRLRGPNP